ncbi:hypothetical protein AYK20_09205 [Thermoplasmatales archaeon SG8-52-1]|nr:MAG: hypothetical protein AYK20_09205 [Thermoplasmatales archaeon SG8-52-1]
MIEVLENVTIVYVDGVKERFDALRLTSRRVITGRIIKTNGTEEFKECGFISRENIKQIYNGTKRKIKSMET